MDALTLSPYIIAKSNLAGDGITNKKLQKLLYYVKVWGVVYFEDGVLSDMQLRMVTESLLKNR